MRQEVTRAHTAKGWALDSVVLYNDVTKMMKEDISAPPPQEIGMFKKSIFIILHELAESLWNLMIGILFVVLTIRQRPSISNVRL